MGSETAPSFSPDGQQVAFAWSPDELPTGMYIKHAGTGRQRSLPNFDGPVTGSPAWSPDGRSIAFDSRFENRPEIFLPPSSGGQAKQLTRGSERSVVPSWPRNGAWIYFASPGDEKMQVWKIHPDGTARTQVTRRGGF